MDYIIMKKLAEAGYVRDVTEYRAQSISYLIKANVIRQVNLGETPYAINDVRLVIGVSCTCVYNKSGKCKHIAALIYYINNHRSISKTSFERQWGDPTARQYVQEKYSKGCSFAIMFPLPHKPYIEPPPIDLSKLIGPSPLKSILLVDETAHEQRMKQILDKSLKEAAENDEKCTKFVKIMLELREVHNVYGRRVSVDKRLIDFYQKSIVLTSSDEIIKLCGDTLQQSKSDTWYAARRLRISASTNFHSIKTRKTKTIEALVREILYPKKFDTPVLRNKLFVHTINDDWIVYLI